MSKRTPIEFEQAMEILAANCKRPGYAVERHTNCVGAERGRIDVVTYKLGEEVLLTTITKRHFNAEPHFYVPAT